MRFGFPCYRITIIALVCKNAPFAYKSSVFRLFVCRNAVFAYGMGVGKRKRRRTEAMPFVPLTVVFSNLLLEGIERLWEVHDYLPNPKRFPLATEVSVS